MMTYVTVGPPVPPVVPPFKVAYPAMPSTVNIREQTHQSRATSKNQKSRTRSGSWEDASRGKPDEQRKEVGKLHTASNM
jgi:hypothetical protein